MLTRFKLGALGAGLFMCSAAGCVAADSAPSEDIGEANDEIVNGTVVTGDTSGVVKVTSSVGGCSGTLVASDWVLTAKHCVGDADVTTPSNIAVTLGDSGQVRSGAQAVRHPTIDVALVQLSSTFTLGGTDGTFINRVYRGTTASLLGKTLSCYGYGYNTYGAGYGTERTGDLTVTSVSAGDYLIGTNAAGQMVNHGDSGGPCTTTIGGVRYQTGVNSWCYFDDGAQIVGPCDQVSAESYRSWVESTITRGKGDFTFYANNNPGYPKYGTMSEIDLVPDDRGSASAVAFLKERLLPPYSVQFEYYIWDNDGSTTNLTTTGDGIVVMLNKNQAAYGTPPAGGARGFINDGTGYGVNFNLFGTRRVYLTDGSLNQLATADNPLVYTGGAWVTAKVDVGVSSIAVSINNVLQFTWSGAVNQAYAGLAFGAATGGADADQRVRNVQISRPNVPYAIIAKHSGKCVDIVAGGTADGVIAQQSSCIGGNANQNFAFNSTGDGYYKVVAKNSGKCLDVTGISTADNAHIQQFDCSGGDNQKFQLVSTQDGFFNLVAKHSGKCVDVYWNDVADGANVVQWTCNGGDNQKFKLVDSNAPASCQDVRNLRSSAADGEYPVRVGESRVSLYCANMASSPSEYLSLPHNGGSYNKSYYGAGGNTTAGGMTTWYTKVRFDPQSLGVGWDNDTTFSTTQGSNNFGTTWMYASAADCLADNSATGTANVDLTGTPFTVATGQFTAQGWHPAGTASYSASNQIVNLTGGGHCGGMQPTPGKKLQFGWLSN